MKRVALIADIHSNLVAFEEVLDQVGFCDVIICAGDLVGYNPWPNQCIQRVRDERILCVMGNHDYVTVFRGEETLNPYARAGIEYCRREITSENRQYLIKLPLRLESEIEGTRLVVCHGSPHSPLDQYVYPWTPEYRMKKIMSETIADFLVLGHTHIPMSIVKGGRHLVNPGSVGQPRDRDPRASYMIVRLEDGSVAPELHRVAYDVNLVVERMEEVGLPRVLAERLKLGV